MSDLTLARLAPSVVLMLKQDASMINAGEAGVLGFDQDGLWIFQGDDDEDNKRPYRDPSGMGLCSIVINTDTAWSSGSTFNTTQFPELQILIWSDASRNADGLIAKHDQRGKAYFLYQRLDEIFHDVANRQHDWLGVPVFSCLRGNGPTVMKVPDTNGTVRLEVTYEIKTA